MIGVNRDQVHIWWAKWIATCCIIIAVISRSVGGFPITDLVLSSVGTLLWLYVSIKWHDRSLIVLNTTMFIILTIGLAKGLIHG